MADTIKVTLVKSGIGKNRKIRETLRGLGLTKLNKTVELNNTKAIRGMINKVLFLVKIDGLVKSPSTGRGRVSPGLG